ncbi:MAG: HAD hydrolase-like protein, partial [Lachnospiraceae bacterium]|nr:HAD hydrolase-like protein [Lachnospiraceae bacterium]MBP5195269.1 HAD hydrolase-like protein [Lachnospiraceae bacterium]
YFCPHNWDEGCDCRKPKPGMLYMAQRDLSLDLSNCVLFGDDDRDIAAADAARVEYHLVSEEYPLINAVKDWLAK